VTRTIALLDLGRLGEARDQIARSLTTAVPDTLGRAQFEHLRGELELMAGRPGEAVRLLDVLAKRLGPGEELAAFVALTRSRALVALGWAPDPVDSWPEMPFFAAGPAEIRAGQLSASGDFDAATALYREAALAWQPHYVRSALWCAWRAAQSRHRAGQDGDSLDLLRVEQEAADRDMLWLLAQVRQSLRKAGLRRAVPPRAAWGSGLAGLEGAGLTAREYQVLTLAAQGLTNTQIGAELGLARRTIETQVASARAKLHARSRSHAAAHLH
jgi:DNA-binding CsgD family transcriptional regulator